MARQIKKPVVYRRHEIDTSGTGVRCVDVAPIPEVATSASANSAMDAMQRLYDKLASGCNYEIFYCCAQSIINEYRAAQHQ
jgi:hypothetical protein